ncbi:heme-binding protein [Rhodopirellula maiorica SM1]|uniref:Heme-binding protein n=1 Tax=Rhodopirellula maiorica SM1 TaxID=1265738 RepID=M5RGR6_9BACT|nr:PVC-type heme-binding CxxCH protein [Rhodopirellula maiorica]EMI18311.1 heme-binding protein [Rhodopirellula maiorica SM1]
MFAHLRLIAAVTFICNLSVVIAEEPTNPTPLRYTKWSGEINVPDPVAISFDNEGTAYVTQTMRRKAQDLDIRNNRDWITNDVGFQSVEDRRNFYHQRLAPNQDQDKNRKRVADLNQDGSHDWHDLTVISEKIHTLRDSDNDGTADTFKLFAEDFRTEVTGIAAGVLWFNGDVYTTIAPDLWRLRDTDNDGVADQRETIASGFAIHIAYAGHDMHGLTVGPDGKIYWSIGDKGISLTSREGKRFHYPNQGGVMRCDPDGSNFEVFAHGLRNVQELAFDQYGNLFGVDNDADQPSEKERFVYIVRDMDAGWRCNYQYRGSGFNPWTDERLWVPHFDGQPSYILPTIKNYIDGPAGFAFNPGTALSSAYRDYFFLTGAPGGHQFAFQAKPAGASFTMENEHAIGSGIPLVGINFGPDGALYGVDWGGGYPLNQSGAVWKIDAPDSDLAKIRSEVAKQIKNGFSKLPASQLHRLLGHDDQRIRMGAQFELVNQQDIDTLQRALTSESEMTRVHAVWGLGQLARGGESTATDALISMLDSADAEMRAQAARTLTDIHGVDGAIFLPLLHDDSDRVRFMAMIALSKHASGNAVEPLLGLSNSLAESERYLRFAASRALRNCATAEQLTAARDSSTLIGRLNLVVALRGNDSARSLEPFLRDPSEQVATEAARALHDDFSSDEQLQVLAAALSTTEHSGESFVRRLLNANYRLGGREQFESVIQYASQEANPVSLRIEAIEMLGSWMKPDALDRVDGRRRYTKLPRELDYQRLSAVLSKLASENHPKLQSAAIDAAARTNTRLSADSLSEIVRTTNQDVELRIAALKTLEKQNPEALKKVLPAAMQDHNTSLQLNAIHFHAKHHADQAEMFLTGLISESKKMAVKQYAIAALGKQHGDASEQRLISMLEQIASNTLSSEITLDVLEAAAQRAEKSPAIQAAFDKANAAIDQRFASTPEKSRPFMVSRDGGDPAKGKVLFNTHLGAQCIRCHKVGKEGSDVGPNLLGIASTKDRDYLLQSVIAPSKDIDKKYQTQSFLLDSGQIVMGLVKSESEEETIISDSQGKEIRLSNDEIEDVSKNEVSIMPDMTDVLTRKEVRDVVAYLATLKSK